MWLIFFFIVIPVIEISLFIIVGQAIGVGQTILLVLLSAVLGTWLIRSQGARVFMDMQQSFRELRDPTTPLAHGALIMFAGVLLLTPGFFTDFLGILLLIPTVRRWLMALMGRHMATSGRSFGFGATTDNGREWADMYDRDVPYRQWPPKNPAGSIDGEYVIEDDPPVHPDDDPPRRGKSGWTRP